MASQIWWGGGRPAGARHGQARQEARGRRSCAASRDIGTGTMTASAVIVAEALGVAVDGRPGAGRRHGPLGLRADVGRLDDARSRPSAPAVRSAAHDVRTSAARAGVRPVQQHAERSRGHNNASLECRRSREEDDREVPLELVGSADDEPWPRRHRAEESDRSSETSPPGRADPAHASWWPRRASTAPPGRSPPRSPATSRPAMPATPSG